MGLLENTEQKQQIEILQPRERGQLDRRAWSQAGLRLLADRGVESVRVEVLARILGVTKGSFYWHFVDRAALLAAMLREWHETTTTAVVEKLWGRPSTPREKLRRLWQICFSQRIDNPGGKLETAIRQWAVHDPDVARAVAAADMERLGFVEKLYAELNIEDPAGMARLFYCHVLGHNAAALHTPGPDPRHDATVMRQLGIGLNIM